MNVPIDAAANLFNAAPDPARCLDCAAPPAPGYARCRACLDQIAASDDAYYSALLAGYRAMYECACCGADQERPGSGLLCAACATAGCDPAQGTEPCPTCHGEGAVLSDRPGVLVGCPTCHGAGIVPTALLTTEQTSVAPATDAGRQALAADRARGAGA